MDYAALLKEKERLLYENRMKNRMELERFFTSLYNIEKDHYNPMKIEEAFPGVEIPDLRQEGVTLESFYPGYFQSVPGSEEFLHDENRIKTTIRSCREIAEKYNKEAEALLCTT